MLIFQYVPFGLSTNPRYDNDNPMVAEWTEVYKNGREGLR